MQTPAEQEAEVHGIALLAPDPARPGAQILTARYVDASGLRVGDDVIIDFTTLKGIGDEIIIDGFVSSVMDPGAIFLLTETGKIAGLSGIWGTNGTSFTGI